MFLNAMHLPAWIENNKLFRFFFLLRKLYLTKFCFKHYSQFAEDVAVSTFFLKDYQGFFVDVGCFHPKKYNNTWQLYKQGWRGVNIDLDAIKIEGFNWVRPKDVNVVAAVSDKAGEVTYYSKGFYSLVSSLDADFAAGKKGYRAKKIQTKTLTQILDQTRFADRVIDFLSVDAEAHDLEVLYSLDFERYQPKLIAVEIHARLFSQVEASPLYQFLQQKNYCLVGWCGLTLLMASEQFQEKLR